MADLLRQEVAALASTLVVKVGTRVLTRADGQLDQQQIGSLVEQIHAVLGTGRKVVLVSSGAVAAGMGRLGLTGRPADLAGLQAVAAVGQSALVEHYERAFAQYKRHAAQILLTAQDMEHRVRYLNARNTLLKLLEFDTVPIINENDTVAVEELQTTFGDNDRLAAIVTNLIRAPLLVLLSDVSGLYDGNPHEPGSRLIPMVSRLDASVFGFIRDKLGGLGKGGMACKLEAARLATTAGENVIIAYGREPDILQKIIAGEDVGTLFLAQGQTVAARKRWIGLTVKPRGWLRLDAGAREAIETKGKSLLAIGILEAEGAFTKGDVLALRDPEDREFARGLTNYSSDEIQRIKGLKTRQISEVLGYCPYDEVIHRDNMAVIGMRNAEC
ncbi:MAG: glutamate 5-kinase [Pirellulales bacterium]|nr:glutamate 5-kinase [Pirellulales bacterium]